MLKKILAVALLIVAAIAIAQGPPINRPPIVDQGNVTITGGTITGLSSPLPVASGGTNAASASITAFNNITGYTAAGATGTTSTNVVFSTSPALTTPSLGVATATSINFGQTALNYYQEGTWTPSPTALTVVGTPTYTGTYTRAGRMVFLNLRVESDTSTAATYLTTTFTGVPVNAARPAVCAGAATGGAGQSLSSGAIIGGTIYVPTWAANSNVQVYCVYESS